MQQGKRVGEGCRVHSVRRSVLSTHTPTDMSLSHTRVLKRREYRLIREQNGLKSLISGLIGGPALLKEWETEWRAKFGGEETDEIDVEPEPLSDDDEGDDEDGDEPSREEDEGRAKKKAKIAKPTKKPKKPTPPTVSVPAVLTTSNQELSPASVVPEKRKRGRPRKNPTSSPMSGPEAVYTTNALPSDHTAMPTDQETQTAVPHSQSQASQYLLATFALFSFFNSPLTQSAPRSASHAHTGVVLGHIHAQQQSPLPIEDGFSWRSLIQAFHLLVSALVFCSILAPWLPTLIKRSRLMSYILSPISWMIVKSEDKPLDRPESKTNAFDRPQLADALDASRRGASNEAEYLRSALGVSSGLLGLAQAMFPKGNSTDQSFEYQGLVQRAWVRLGELAVLDCTSLFFPIDGLHVNGGRWHSYHFHCQQPAHILVHAFECFLVLCIAFGPVHTRIAHKTGIRIQGCDPLEPSRECAAAQNAREVCVGILDRR